MYGSREQDYWLRKAEELEWSRNQLRNEVRNSLRLRQPDGPPRIEGRPADVDDHAADTRNAEVLSPRGAARVLSLRLTSRQFSQFATIAHSRNQDLEEWALQVLESVDPAPG
jgi:hypothetical protein